MSVEKLILGIANFSKEKCFANSEYNNNVEKGQSAKILVIGCSDSLVDPLSLMNSSPGEIFVYRNIAGLVPEYKMKRDNIHATSAILDFSMNNLKVTDVIILGHGHCGGIKSILKSRHECGSKRYVEHWADIARPALEKLVQQNKNLSFNELRNLCEKESVRNSIKNLKTYPCVESRYHKKEIKIHGWHFDRGTLSILENDQWIVKIKAQND